MRAPELLLLVLLELLLKLPFGELQAARCGEALCLDGGLPVLDQRGAIIGNVPEWGTNEVFGEVSESGEWRVESKRC